MVKCLVKIIIESQRRKRIFMKWCGIDPYSTDAFENLGKINILCDGSDSLKNL